MKKINKYYCKLCGKTIEKMSDKKWMNSYCDDKGDLTRIYKMNKKNATQNNNK